MLEIISLNKSYGKNKVLTDINLKIEENKIYGLLGRNGVGKTTLLSLVANQLLRDSGEIRLDGEEVFENPRTIIISTHLIDEVANLFEEVIILNDERITLKEEVSVLKERSYFLSGQEELINRVIKDKRAIYKDEFGSKSIIGIYGHLTEEDRNYIRANNIEMSSIPLQKLFVYLTENMVKGDFINEFNK